MKHIGLFLMFLSVQSGLTMAVEVDGEYWAGEIESSTPALKLPSGSSDILVVLPPLNVDEENEISYQKKLNGKERFSKGFERSLPFGYSKKLNTNELLWRDVEGGKAAILSFTSPHAKSLRIALNINNLASGVQLRFYNSSFSSEIYGPYPEAGFQGQYWSPVVKGHNISLEFFVPSGIQPKTINIAGMKLIHNWR